MKCTAGDSDLGSVDARWPWVRTAAATRMKMKNHGTRSWWTRVVLSASGQYGGHTPVCTAWIDSFTAASLTAVSADYLRWLRILFRRSEPWYVQCESKKSPLGGPDISNYSDKRLRIFNWFLPARRYASAGNSDRNVSVCPSVCLSRAGIVSKRRKLAARFLHHLVAPRL